MCINESFVNKRSKHQFVAVYVGCGVANGTKQHLCVMVNSHLFLYGGMICVCESRRLLVCLYTSATAIAVTDATTAIVASVADAACYWVFRVHYTSYLRCMSTVAVKLVYVLVCLFFLFSCICVYLCECASIRLLGRKIE